MSKQTTAIDAREIARRLALMEKRVGRRSLFGGALAAAGLAAGVRFAPATAARQDAALPDDAAPADQQVLVVPSDPNTDKTPDFYEAVYERVSDGSSDVFSDPLVRLNRNFEIIPAAATEWSSNEDGTVWTFKLDPNLMWNDGTPVTANDWVATFRYGADPAHAWDFTWFFQGVMKGWDEAIAGEIPLEELGVVAEDDHTLVVTTVLPAPYLPTMLLYSCTLSAKALAESGPLYNSNPETSVSSGPFMLEEWSPDQRVVYVKNPDYKGTLVVPVEKVVIKLASQNTWFTMYQNDEIDYMQKPAPAELQIAQAQFPDQIYSSVGDFRTFYLFFDVTKAPFDDIRVRQAFSHVVDRDAIQQQILGPAGRPAYSWLAPGFPASNSEGLKEIQKFDPELAKQLLADAGFPNGEGFPAQELWLRNANALDQSIAGAIAASIKSNLGIDVEVSNKDQDSFMDALTAKPTEIPFGYVSYGMDFLDPFNMLSVWLSGGRHSWANDEFDGLVKEAASFIGDPAERITMFQDAEKVLVEDVPAVFVYHETPVQLVKPWVKGAALEPDANGITSIHWPSFSAMSTVFGELYITADAPAGRGDM
jgi:peptide/nickel transport system substrate-binding protein/oligopeptide transport system substrate-binding protein